MPVISTTIHSGQGVSSIPEPVKQNIKCRTMALMNDRIFCTFIVWRMKNIEIRVAWFLAELCKAEKGMQKDKRNQLGQSSLGRV